MTLRSPFIMGLAAVLLTACAMALGGPGPSRPAPVQGSVRPQPFTCALVARESAGHVELEGRLEAREDLDLSYEMRVRGPGVSADQSGSFTIAAGESAVLGEASLSGTLDDLDVGLTLTADGRSATCPIQSP